MSETIQTKQCPQCKTIKPFSDFYKNKSKKDGVNSECKMCSNKYQRQYRQSDEGIFYRKNYQKNYYNTQKGKEAFTRGRKKWEHSPKGKIARQESAKQYYVENKEKHCAKNRVNYAIRKGRMHRASNFTCQICNVNKAQDYHHYLGHEPEHWLDVIPVCRKCHYAFHH